MGDALAGVVWVHGLHGAHAAPRQRQFTIVRGDAGGAIGSERGVLGMVPHCLEPNVAL